MCSMEQAETYVREILASGAPARPAHFLRSVVYPATLIALQPCRDVRPCLRNEGD